jgi:hypothetical protein
MIQHGSGLVCGRFSSNMHLLLVTHKNTTTGLVLFKPFSGQTVREKALYI